MDKQIAAFLDRDGTLCEEVGYLNHPDQLIIYPWTPEAVRLLNRARIKVIVVTNQSGVARGYFEEDVVLKIHERMQKLLADEGARLDAIFYCPHHSDYGLEPYRQNCNCRKPRPGMILKAAQEFNIELEKSYVIGDRYIEIELAKAVGATSIFLLSGYGKGEYEYQRHTWLFQPDYIAENLIAGVEWILDGNQSS